MDSPATPLPPPARSLAWWLSASIGVFVLIASLGLLAVFQHLGLKQEEEAFAALTSSNTNFLRTSQLPRSPEMEARLGAVMDAVVKFLPATPPTAVRRQSGMMLVTHSLDEKNSVLFSRPTDGDLAFLSDRRTWLALGVFWLSSLALGGWLARGLTGPLRELTRVLPAMGASAPLPPLPTTRSDEIGELARALDATHRSLADEKDRRRAAERLAILGRMAASLAHEVRNPVAAIRLHAQLLEGAPEAEAEASRSLIASEAERIESLVTQWMRYARPEPPKLEQSDFGELATMAIQRAAAQAAHAGVTISGLESPPPAPVRVDRDRLLQAIINVILNAIQAQPRGGTVRLDLRTEGQYHVLQINDSGNGFSDAALRQLGEPFFSEKEGGMGLGLAVASEILTAHGGSLNAENIADGGARVSLRLPKI